MDLLALLNTFAMYILYGTVIRQLFYWIFPKGMAEGFDMIALAIRNLVVRWIEKLWGEDDNAETILMSRIIGPFFVMLLTEGMVAFIAIQYSQYFVLEMVFQVFRFFVFINVAPAIDDWQKLFESRNITKAILIFKISIVLAIMQYLDTETIILITGIDNAYMAIFAAILPVSKIHKE